MNKKLLGVLGVAALLLAGNFAWQEVKEVDALGEKTWSLCGTINGWDPSDTTYDMKWDSTKERYEVVVELATNAEFKVVRDHKWGGDIGWDNYSTDKGKSNYLSDANGNFKVKSANTYLIYLLDNDSANHGFWAGDLGIEVYTETPEEPVKMYEVTINYYNSNSWDEVYLHSWVEGGETDTGAWPGKQMTEVDENWYSCTFNTSDLTATNIIFNNNSGAQTGNLTNIDTNKTYFYGDGTTQYSSKDEVISVLEYTLPNLFTKYAGNGVYTKKTTINASEEVKEDLASYFLGSIQLDRTTYFNDDSLLMCDYNGNVTTGEGHINSGYGTVTADNIELVKEATKNNNVVIGDMTHFKYVDGAAVYDYTVKNTHGNWKDKTQPGMEGFYTTARDFAKENYFDSSWTKDGQSFIHIINKEDEKSLSYLKDFLDVAAPCLLDTVVTSEFFTVTKLVVKEENNSLYLQICLDEDTVEGKLDVETNVLAEAVIQKGHMKTIYFTNNNGWDNVYAYTFDGSLNNGWPGVAATNIGANDYGQDVYSYEVDLSVYSTIIFNANTNNGNSYQTVDIVLDPQYNAYYLSGSTDASGKQEVIAIER